MPLPLGDRIAQAIALNYNLSTCYLILIILQERDNRWRGCLRAIARAILQGEWYLPNSPGGS